ncbi:MAG: AAA family ATPase, partial [Malacoplasma sp.]|nr:AAA family ATPase [Malacoplasma sp.]
MDFSQIPFYDLNKAEQNLSTVSEDINGFRQKIKRYFHAISHAIDGNYRNPYLLHSINATPEIKEIKELPLEIVSKYNLNPKQLESVKKAISSRDTFYLQGPPGTGKTQVISAITDVLINQNKNVLMTSSTHEAIHNFFDRLNDLSNKNPNIILLKDSATDREAKYSESNLYKNFIQKIKNHLLNEDSQDDSLIEEIEKIKDEIINEEIWEFKNISSETIKNLISKKFDELSDYEKEIKTKITEENFMDHDATVPEDILRRWSEKEFRKHTRNLKHSEKIKEICDKNYQLTGKQKSLKEIYYGNKKSSDSKTIEKIKEFFSKRDSEKIKGYQKEFNSYIFEKEIINVIGITTTAKTEIQIGTNKKNLFFEYPIDTVIIDEISKSSTPEILARIILSKKVIFAGDYMQLPPASDIDDSTIEKILINEKLTKDMLTIFGKKEYENNTKEELH